MIEQHPELVRVDVHPFNPHKLVSVVNPERVKFTCENRSDAKVMCELWNAYVAAKEAQ